MAKTPQTKEELQALIDKFTGLKAVSIGKGAKLPTKAELEAFHKKHGKKTPTSTGYIPKSPKRKESYATKRGKLIRKALRGQILK